ncbi:bifunctional molybdenum cofactor biosynthesis protein MoaC/MoaB [Sphingobacteriales bacterium UPWRP_1]|nr:bifunctional molybdenum cofactor biosynthesis protein MoaC/MoaB [Sphingobacteriales bacterium TSM_CSS]PSJ73035.1 bifunctional molybdenum cofactor biosynthesis protein MoaC/MoaB [Sphingobacteriales bacterium UPWRP_1]
MNNITQKITTLRKAVACAVLKVSTPQTIAAIENRQVPKGDVREFARAAGLLAIKKTSDVIPDCHPLPIEYAAITSALNGLEITITVEVHTIYRTGVEVEAMHGAAIAALTMYDMLKPLDKGIEISTIKLMDKKGGKSDFSDTLSKPLRAAVVVCSDSVFAGKKTDTAGKAIIEKLQTYNIQNPVYRLLPDEKDQIQQLLLELCANGQDLILITGGTGLSARDVTPEAVKPLITREIPGIMEAARNYGQSRTPYAMLSRGVAGMVGNTLVITLPGSTRGAQETIDALFPYLLHVFKVAEGARHD